MKDTAATFLRVFLAILLAVSAVLFAMFYIRGEEFTSVVLTWGYILLGFTALITVIFPIINTILNPRSGRTVLIGLIGFVILYVISHSFASGSIEGEVYQTFNITEGVSRFIGAMLNMTFILAALAVLSIIYSAISTAFK